MKIFPALFHPDLFNVIPTAFDRLLMHVLLKTSSLFAPFPPEMGTDTAFLDRIHCYLPGWEIPKFRPEYFTDDYGFITDYLAEFIRELHKEQYGDALDRYFRLGTNLNQRDTIAVRKMVGGLLKLALEMRRRVKEQLKKLGGMEFYDVSLNAPVSVLIVRQEKLQIPLSTFSKQMQDTSAERSAPRQRTISSIIRIYRASA